MLNLRLKTCYTLFLLTSLIFFVCSCFVCCFVSFFLMLSAVARQFASPRGHVVEPGHAMMIGLFANCARLPGSVIFSLPYSSIPCSRLMRIVTPLCSAAPVSSRASRELILPLGSWSLCNNLRCPLAAAGTMPGHDCRSFTSSNRLLSSARKAWSPANVAR